MDDWGRYIEVVAEAFFGKPTSRKNGEVRYGGRGSLKINIESGFWDDWQSGESGGTLALIKREKGLEPKEAIEWMKSELKLDIEDRRPANSTRPDTKPADKDPPPKQQGSERGKIVKTYDYVNERGELLFQVCRMEPKNFLQRRKPREGDDPKDIKQGWVWKRDGITQVPYRLPELMEAIADERLIIIAEGEKDVDNLCKLGVPATTIAGGAGKWPDEVAPYFRDIDIVVLPDNDPQARKPDGALRWHPDGRPVLPGQDHAKMVAAKLDGVAKSVRILPLPDLPPKGDVSDWIEAGGTSEALYRLVYEQAISPAEYQALLDQSFRPKTFVSKFGAFVWGEPRQSRQRYEYLIKGLIPRRETVLIYGPSQSGKSFLTQDFGMAVARGGDYQGRKVKRGIVVYCAPEAGVGFIDRRMPGYAVGKGVSESEWLPFVCLPARLDLFNDDKQTDELIEEIRYWVSFLKEKFPDLELEAVIFDTFNKSTPGLDEISGKDMSTVMRRFDRIRDALNTGLWVVHHKNAAGTGPRGHTSMYAGFEVAIEVGRTEEKIKDDGKQRDKRFMLMQKQREGEDSGRSYFYLRGVILDYDEDGEPIPSCVVQWLGNDEQEKVERERLDAVRMTDQHRMVYRALKRALLDYGVAPPPSLNLPKSIDRVVDAKYWRQVYRTDFALEDDSQEAIRKALTRANNFMIAKGVIGRSNPWAWITGMNIKGEPRRPEPIEEEAELNSEMDEATDWSDRTDLGEAPPPISDVDLASAEPLGAAE